MSKPTGILVGSEFLIFGIRSESTTEETRSIEYHVVPSTLGSGTKYGYTSTMLEHDSFVFPSTREQEAVNTLK